MKTRDLLGLIAAGAFLGFVLLFPGVIQDIPNLGWLIIGIGFMSVCLAELWRQGQLKNFLKRGAIAMLLFIPCIALISLLPGEPQRDFSWWWLIGLIVAPLAILAVVVWRTNFFNQLKEMFARHPPACEKCLAPRKDLVWLEPPASMTCDEQRRSLCPECVWNEIETQLSGLSNRLIAAEPVRNANGYYSLNADGIAEWWNSEGDGPTATRRILNAVEQILDQVSGRCEKCGATEANVCWVPAEAFRNKWDKFSDLLGYKPDKLLNEDSLRFLCGGCTARTARDSAQARRVRLHLVSSPSSGTLVILPGEA